ncbi:hypothetical protein [Bacillus cereus]|uniref:Uncharacterized protein n=1 Tax=Bacillus cereus VD184 TaxID=1053242 RepID=A0A9W5VPE5_BACCE|nr:hypothetical protein [Bacillus cereus]EOQ00998.1 hypothetical protein IKC_06196 [Bacillus cereus VD184]
MDILKNYARMVNKEPTEVTSVRIPKSLHRSFKKHCENYGLGIAEAINILIRNELGDAYKQHLHEDESNKLQEKLSQKSPSPQKVTAKSSLRKQSGRFLTTEYQVDGDLPCPICGEWKSSTNFARHVKTNHKKTTQEIFTENHEKAISMVKARTSQI